MLDKCWNARGGQWAGANNSRNEQAKGLNNFYFSALGLATTGDDCDRSTGVNTPRLVRLLTLPGAQVTSLSNVGGPAAASGNVHAVAAVTREPDATAATAGAASSSRAGSGLGICDCVWRNEFSPCRLWKMKSRYGTTPNFFSPARAE